MSDNYKNEIEVKIIFGDSGDHMRAQPYCLTSGGSRICMRSHSILTQPPQPLNITQERGVFLKIVVLGVGGCWRVTQTLTHRIAITIVDAQGTTMFGNPCVSYPFEEIYGVSTFSGHQEDEESQKAICS